MTDSQQALQSGEPQNDFNVDRPSRSSSTTANGNTDELEPHHFEDGCDDCPPMTGRTLGYWLTLVFFVGPFYVIPPLSWAYTVYVTVRLGEAWKRKAPLLRALPIWAWLLLAYTVFEVGGRDL